MVVSAAELYAGVPAAEPTLAAERVGEPPAPLWRKLLALLVMAILVAAIVLLVTRFLAR